MSGVYSPTIALAFSDRLARVPASSSNRGGEAINRNDVTKEQEKRISKALDRPTNYLIRLWRRMEQLGFPRNDSLFLLVCAAHEAIKRLRLDTHYLACGISEAGHDGHAPTPTL